MTMAIITTQAVMGAVTDEVHALAEEIHQQEGLLPIDALCKALAMQGELAAYAGEWDASIARMRNVEVSS